LTCNIDQNKNESIIFVIPLKINFIFSYYNLWYKICKNISMLYSICVFSTKNISKIVNVQKCKNISKIVKLLYLLVKIIAPNLPFYDLEFLGRIYNLPIFNSYNFRVEFTTKIVNRGHSLHLPGYMIIHQILLKI